MLHQVCLWQTEHSICFLEKRVDNESNYPSPQLAPSAICSKNKKECQVVLSTICCPLMHVHHWSPFTLMIEPYFDLQLGPNLSNFGAYVTHFWLILNEFVNFCIFSPKNAHLWKWIIYLWSHEIHLFRYDIHL